MNRASTSDAARAYETVLGITLKNSPVLPVITSMGVKASTVVKAELITGIMTSATPSTIDSLGDLPICIWR